jgi:hypothetical protein
MRPNLLPATLLLGYLALAGYLASAAGSQAQEPAEKYRLTSVSQVGDVVVHEVQRTLDLDVTGTAGETTLGTFRFASDEVERYREEVLSVDAQGQPTGLRRTYAISKSSETNPDGTKEEVSSKQGKAIAIRRKNGKTVVTTAGGKLSADDLADLQDELDPGPELLPRRPVGVGETWTVNLTKQALASMKGLEVGSLKGRLQEIVDYGGRRCARVHLVMALSGHPSAQKGMRMTATLEGDEYFALDLQRELGGGGTGPLTCSGSIQQNGATIKLKGTGTLEMRDLHQWIKIGGQPVPQPATPSDPASPPSPSAPE